MTVKLGEGFLNWHRAERITDRYGAIMLFKDANPEDDANTIALTSVEESTYGELFVVIKETRESHHIGDWARGLYPSTPKQGSRLSLGKGTLFFDEHNQVGLKPTDGRDHDWLNPRNLYKAHEQLVELYFRKINVN